MHCSWFCSTLTSGVNFFLFLSVFIWQRKMPLPEDILPSFACGKATRSTCESGSPFTLLLPAEDFELSILAKNNVTVSRTWYQVCVGPTSTFPSSACDGYIHISTLPKIKYGLDTCMSVLNEWLQNCTVLEIKRKNVCHQLDLNPHVDSYHREPPQAAPAS